MSDLLAALNSLRERLKEIPQADERRLQELKTELLGRRSGALTEILKAVPGLEPDERRRVGGTANALKRELEGAIAAREQELKRGATAVAGVDLTMPARPQWRGGLHLVTQVVDEICDIFRELGFTRVTGPEAETERYNFYALNFPKDHPALDGALPALILPVHRTVRRDGCAMPDLRGLGLRGLQTDRLDGDPWLRHGASRRARELQRR